MAMPLSDDIFDEVPSRASLRIAPLQDIFPGLPTASARPSPLEPNARGNIDSESNKLTGRRKALAQAKPLEAPEPTEWETLAPAQLVASSKAQQSDHLSDRPSKKQKLYDHEQIADFVQLPKPQTKAKEDQPRPFRPFAVLNELHEPPPSAALFPPITPSASQEEHDGLPARERSVKATKGEANAPARKKAKERSTSPSTAKRTYNRGRTRWTEAETEQLVKGVAIYGMGRWKNILEHPEFEFQKGRTGMDLKDRFRVCFPPNAADKWVKPVPVFPESDDDKSANLPAVTKASPHKDGRLQVRNRKRHWTEEEDAELDKGFRLYGYQWNLMVKDPNLHFEHRSGGQIRDRFRLRFPELYNQQDAAAQQKKQPPDKRASQNKKQQPQGKPMTERNSGEKTSDSTDQGKCDDATSEGYGKGASARTLLAPSFSSGLLNADDEDNRLSNSILHYDWDDLTLAPVAWEDMANKPMFPFD